MQDFCLNWIILRLKSLTISKTLAPLNQSAAWYLQNLSIEYEASKFVQIAYNLYNELLVCIFIISICI